MSSWRGRAMPLPNGFDACALLAARSFAIVLIVAARPAKFVSLGSAHSPRPEPIATRAPWGQRPQRPRPDSERPTLQQSGLAAAPEGGLSCRVEPPRFCPA